MSAPTACLPQRHGQYSSGVSDLIVYSLIAVGPSQCWCTVVVVTPLEAGRCTMLFICRYEFVAHKITLTHMESLICALHPDFPRAKRAERAEPCLSSFGL